jgi:hypothetical protein
MQRDVHPGTGHGASGAAFGSSSSDACAGFAGFGATVFAGSFAASFFGVGAGDERMGSEKSEMVRSSADFFRFVPFAATFLSLTCQK